MKTMTVEMPEVSKCAVNDCTYNVAQNCHARAITVGDLHNPECDTYFAGTQSIKSVQQIAGVGACKVVGCKYNDDFECSTNSIEVGFSGPSVKCLTYQTRA